MILSRIFIILSFLSISSVTNANIDSIIENSLSALNKAKETFRNSPVSENPRPISEMSGSDSLFGLKFDPNSSFSFDVSITKPSLTRTEVTNPNNPTGKPLSAILEAKNPYESYMTYKCNTQRDEVLAASNPAVSADLNASIDMVLDSVMQMESSIKSSINSTVTGMFDSINSYFRPEFVMSKTMEVMINKGAEVTCGNCRKSNQIGCNSVFMLGEQFKKILEADFKKMTQDSKAIEFVKKDESGAIIEWGYRCPNKAELTLPSGIGFLKKYTKIGNSKKYTSEYIQSIKDGIDGDIMNQCIESERTKIRTFFEDVLNTAASTIVLEVETQDKCLEENSDGFTQASKSKEVLNKTIKSYFTTMNDYIANDLNKPAQEMTGSIISKMNQKIDILNTGAIPVDDPENLESTKVALAKIMEPHQGTSANASIQDLMDYSITKISQQPSSSMSKKLTYDMTRQLTNALHLKDVFMTMFTLGYDNISATDIDETIDFVSKSNDLSNILTDYEDILTQEVSFPPTRPAPYFACSKFADEDVNGTAINNPDVCFQERKIQRFTTNYAQPTNCTCVEFGKLIDIISNPISKKDDILKNLIPPAKRDNEHTWGYQFDKLVFDIKTEYLNVLAASLVGIQSESDEYLSNMHIMEQQEVKRLFRMTLKNFKL